MNTSTITGEQTIHLRAILAHAVQEEGRFDAALEREHEAFGGFDWDDLEIEQERREVVVAQVATARSILDQL